MKAALRGGGILGGLGIVLFGLALGLSVAAPREPLDWVSNRPENVARAAAGGETFRVAVLGDTQNGLAVFDDLLAALAGESIDFAIHGGDLVCHDTPGHWKLVLSHAAASPLRCPIFVAPGNHDISERDGGARFERFVGPRQVVIDRGRASFFILDNARRASIDEAWLEDQLQRRAGRMLAVHLHRPPFRVDADRIEANEGYERFLELCRRHAVRYVFCGHAHEYKRIADDGLTYVINGVGGDYSTGEFGRDGWATILEVDGTQATDRALRAPKRWSAWTEVRHAAIGHMDPAASAAGLGLCVLLGAVCARALRSRRGEAIRTP
jgi:Icc-related predicted phosphoesterase